MPLKKLPTKKAAGKGNNKCPWCGSRSYKDAEKLNMLEKLRYIGCEVWECLKCSKKWAG